MRRIQPSSAGFGTWPLLNWIAFWPGAMAIGPYSKWRRCVPSGPFNGSAADVTVVVGVAAVAVVAVVAFVAVVTPVTRVASWVASLLHAASTPASATAPTAINLPLMREG